MAAYWLNVDTAGTCTLHKNDCRHVEAMEATDKKKIGDLGPNGGWLPFDTAVAAEQHSRSNWPARKFKRCGDCHP